MQLRMPAETGAEDNDRDGEGETATSWSEAGQRHGRRLYGR